ncbi:MAG: type II secretion system protein [Pseudomonadota bacterium]
MRQYNFCKLARGFTLVEAIIVMVVTGILAGMVAVFIKIPVQNYVDSTARAELTDIADLSLRRMSRELRLALPNSILVQGASSNTIQFLITKTGGRYVDLSDSPPPTVKPLNFYDATATTFNLVGAAPTGRQQIVAGDRIVVYNLGILPASAYTGSNVATVNSISGTLVTLASNPFATQNPLMDSPDHRFQVVIGTVTYVCNPVANGTGTLKRYFSSTIPPSEALSSPVVGIPALLANMVSACSFDYVQLPNTHSALIGINLTLRRSNGESTTLSRQVHVDNTP